MPLEPKIPHTARVAREVLEGNKTFEVVNGQVLDKSRLRHANVDRHGVPSLLIRLERAPVRHACTSRAEVVLKVWATDIGTGGSSGRDLLALVSIDPQSSPTPARGAVAGSR